MDKLLIGAIIALILLALIPIKSDSFDFTNLDPVSATIADDAEENQSLLIHLAETNQMDNSELMQAESVETGNEEMEIEPEMAGSDRGIFISIGSILLFGIILLLPLQLQKI